MEKLTFSPFWSKYLDISKVFKILPQDKEIIKLYQIKNLWSIYQIQSRDLLKMHLKNSLDFQNERVGRSKSHCVTKE